MGSSFSSSHKQTQLDSRPGPSFSSSESLQTNAKAHHRIFKAKNLPETEFLRNSRQSSVATSRCSMHKPLSRHSRRRRHECTLSSVSGVSKTTWPVKICESIFLPEFRIKEGLNETNFKVLEEIGRGAYSVVYRVMMINCGQEFAMKVLSKAKVVEEDTVNQVKEEVMIQSSCGHHPLIATLNHSWQSRHFLFIVSEFFSGGELWQLLNNYRTLPEGLVRIYIAEIALALDFLHNAGVIYRDIKLENMVLDKHGHIRLIDFGLSKWLKYGSRTSTLCGTLQFIAPEVFEGSYGHAADWWSLGVVACLLITGQYPSVVQRRMAEISCNGQDTNISPNPITTPEHGGTLAARDLFGRLLQPNPQQRLRSLISLKSILFFKGFSFEDVLEKKISPNSLLPRTKPEESTTNNLLCDFESWDQPYNDRL